MESEKQRTLRQNKAAHKWFRDIADVLNDAGYEQKITIGTADTPWTEWAVKAMFKKIAKAMYGTPHSSELDKMQFSKVAETMNRLFGEQGGTHSISER